MIVYLLGLVLAGLITGALARLALPGPDPMSLFATILLGIAGSFVAGLIVWAVHGRGGAGIVLSVLCSTVILYAVRRSRGGSLTQSGRGPVGRA